MFTALLAILVLAALALLWRILAEFLVRIVIGFFLALFLGLTGGLISTDFGHDGIVFGALLMLLATIPCFLFASQWRTARRPIKMQDSSFAGAQSGERKAAIEDQFDIENAQELREAWANASHIAPGIDLSASREACAHFLSAVSCTNIMDAGLIELGVLIRKHVPGLARDTQEVLRSADDAEAEEAIQQMLQALKGLGDEAANALDRIKTSAQERLAARCDRLSQIRADGLKFQ